MANKQILGYGGKNNIFHFENNIYSSYYLLIMGDDEMIDDVVGFGFNNNISVYRPFLIFVFFNMRF